MRRISESMNWFRLQFRWARERCNLPSETTTIWKPALERTVSMAACWKSKSGRTHLLTSLPPVATLRAGDTRAQLTQPMAIHSRAARPGVAHQPDLLAQLSICRRLLQARPFNYAGAVGQTMATRALAGGSTRLQSIIGLVCVAL